MKLSNFSRICLGIEHSKIVFSGMLLYNAALSLFFQESILELRFLVLFSSLALDFSSGIPVTCVLGPYHFSPNVCSFLLKYILLILISFLFCNYPYFYLLFFLRHYLPVQFICSYLPFSSVSIPKLCFLLFLILTWALLHNF